MNELLGKRALVTGGSRGIGAGIALALADKGADVAISYERSADRAGDVVRSIEAKGRRAVAIAADSADPAAMKRLVDQTIEKLGGLDILVNNAGIARMGMVVDMSLADIDALLNVNVRAAVLAAQAAIPHLGEGGRILIVGSSVAERTLSPGVAVYSMTKSALVAFTRGLARELGPRDITVNLVQPGFTDTDMNPADGVHGDMLRGMTPLGRFGTPGDVAAAAAFLASPAARQITGATITVDGGLNT
ncbi:glucose 1-dehydrogenase [Rhizobium sp. Root1220]|uniref:glucose 1-dehydrogenase n=1 Tax=Rhizobium sp. Root1220 TaxID=1736432 RepID=UPI0006FF9A84|nr:glucose 1-dehydrogenase [Rhizobium sp. Root1220]KQV84248.1 oxidoreductase [Rhizobium sp. Root1220]